MIDLVDGVNARDVNSRPLYHINQVINSRVVSQVHVGIVDAVLRAHGLDGVQVEIGNCHSGRQADAALLLSSKGEVGRFIVEPEREKGAGGGKGRSWEGGRVGGREGGMEGGREGLGFPLLPLPNLSTPLPLV